MHADVFRSERRFTFIQIYFDPAKHGERLTRDIDKVRAQLWPVGSSDLDLTSFGDAFLLERRLEAAPTNEITKQFGDKFMEKLANVPIGRWSGPIESGYGVHLVFVEDRAEGRLPELAEVRDAVLRDWTNARRLDSNEKYFQSLLKHYQVVIEEIAPAKAGQKIASAK